MRNKKITQKDVVNAWKAWDKAREAREAWVKAWDLQNKFNEQERKK